MIKEFEIYHGAVFSMLFHHSIAPITIVQYPSSDNASYIVNDDLVIYIKYSTKRLSPWSFSFQKMHLTEISEINNRYDNVVILLVCRDDGIAGLTLGEFYRITDNEKEATESVSVVRKAREKYTVKGSLGKLPYKIGMSDFCDKILCQVR